MPTTAFPQPIPAFEPAGNRHETAAALLEEARKLGCQEPAVPYLTALAYKRQGKTQAAREALKLIPTPDSNVWLQLGLLSLAEQMTAQAEGEFARARQLDAASYEACFNLAITRLCLGHVEGCLELLPAAAELAPNHAEQRFLECVRALLRSCQHANGHIDFDLRLTEMTADEQNRLLRLLRGLGQIEFTLRALQVLASARPDSPAVQEAVIEAALVKAKGLADRCQWIEAEKVLSAYVSQRGSSRPTQVALLNLLGVAACMCQDFIQGVRHFNAAVKLAPLDARLHQNLALAHEWLGNLSDADPHWNRYFELVNERLLAPPGHVGYVDHLAFEALSRLATRYTDSERWSSAIVYLERARELRPKDADMLERLFHLYIHAHCGPEARLVLDELAKLRPDDPQMELLKLDTIELKNLGDVEQIVNQVDRIVEKHHGDTRVEERAMALVSSVVPLMGHLCDQLSERLGKIVRQVRRLENYQVNWQSVEEASRDLLHEYQRLKRITGKCLPLVGHEEHRRIIRELGTHIERKMEVCKSLRERE
jgi:tetratricopeptide (TPR) repeat protein